jgi:thiosulfate dehydrogenase
MKKQYAVVFTLIIPALVYLIACNTQPTPLATIKQEEELLPVIDMSQMPQDSIGVLIKYGHELMVNTAHYIGPNGVNGKYLGNNMNCTNCHQEAGTKPFAFNLMESHDNYPQYRAREGKVLTLAERVNNCVMRPHNGKPLPLNSREMVAYLSYFKWINSFITEGKKYKGTKPLPIEFPDVAANPERGKQLFATRCLRCHGVNGDGLLNADKLSYQYPPLWGDHAYQPGSSMHRVIKQAQWLKANMPFDSAKWNAPVLTDVDALDIAAFVNNDNEHKRPNPTTFDYPNATEKAIDYAKPPFADTFSANTHKNGPYKPIINYWKGKGMKPTY